MNLIVFYLSFVVNLLVVAQQWFFFPFIVVEGSPLKMQCFVYYCLCACVCVFVVECPFDVSVPSF